MGSRMAARSAADKVKRERTTFDKVMKARAVTYGSRSLPQK
ncbi:hypothetical protein COLO4_02619 [Corchorus olitorius]|uniref:Uncharacterized protein n=1 Tax=Corchorus olitorius TaxID=93759 RepID=A0A1R3L0L7_9ROSI|nr:hypothetical protein COLO4_02619 [Corchorus olitorius]